MWSCFAKSPQRSWHFHRYHCTSLISSGSHLCLPISLSSCCFLCLSCEQLLSCVFLAVFLRLPRSDLLAMPALVARPKNFLCCNLGTSIAGCLWPHVLVRAFFACQDSNHSNCPSDYSSSSDNCGHTSRLPMLTTSAHRRHGNHRNCDTTPTTRPRGKTPQEKPQDVEHTRPLETCPSQ